MTREFKEGIAILGRMRVNAKLRSCFGNPNVDSNTWGLYKINLNNYPEDENDRAKYVIRYRELKIVNDKLEISNGENLSCSYDVSGIDLYPRNRTLCTYDLFYKDGYLGMFTDEKHSDKYLNKTEEM